VAAPGAEAVRAAMLRRRLDRQLGKSARGLVVVEEEAARLGTPAFLIGGPVRDLILELPVGDLDVLVEKGLKQLTERVAGRLDARAEVRERFLTASVEGGGLRLDLSQARRESYARPGALPRVAPASIEEDFPRRDFSVNAMALPLSARSGDEVLDPCGGLADLERRRLRVLHSSSFQDDPTRMLRGARYAARLGFRLEAGTNELFREALSTGALESISGDRIRRELEHLLLAETEPSRAALMTERLGLFTAIARGWRLSLEGRRALRALARLGPGAAWPATADTRLRWEYGLRALLWGSSAVLRARVLERLAIRGRPAEEVGSDLRRFARLRRALSRSLSPGQLDARLADVSEPLLLLLFCSGGGSICRQVQRYAADLRHRPNPLNGHDARRHGAVGPQVGELIRTARRRVLDGTPLDEAWIGRWLARRSR
jgi:tRNA nucleotidyltransferase (CCA-adding enzyme)